MNAPDYPTPDPAWEYYELWNEVRGLKDSLDQFIYYVATLEEITPEIDSRVKANFKALSKQFEAIADRIE
jgi:hypothetical protein